MNIASCIPKGIVSGLYQIRQTDSDQLCPEYHRMIWFRGISESRACPECHRMVWFRGTSNLAFGL